jgi:MFS family permease
MIGTLAGGTLVAFAPEPTHLIYALLFALTVIGIVALAFMPETITGRPGALAAMRPHISVPQRARATLLKVTPVNVAGWSLGGFYLSLMPTLVAVTTGITSPFVGGTVVSTLMLAATASVFVFRTWAPQRVLFTGTTALMIGVLITLSGVHLQAVGLLFLGTAVAGLGFGSIFSNILKIVLPLAESHERAGLFAAFLVESYLAFSIPAIAAGLIAPTLGLSNTAYVYGGAIITLAVISIATTSPKARPYPETASLPPSRDSSDSQLNQIVKKILASLWTRRITNDSLRQIRASGAPNHHEGHHENHVGRAAGNRGRGAAAS